MPPDFLVWRANIFAFGEYSTVYYGREKVEYRNFSLNRASHFFLFYYDAKYSEEIFKTHIIAAKEYMKEFYEEQKQQDRQLEENF